MLQFPGCSNCFSSLVNARFLQVSGDPLQQLNSHKLSLCWFPDSTYFEEQMFCSTRSMCKPKQPSELQFLCCWHTNRCTCTDTCTLMYLHVCARPPRLCPREHLSLRTQGASATRPPSWDDASIWGLIQAHTDTHNYGLLKWAQGLFWSWLKTDL